jgi:dipeptidyl aminopeptidase/acylaminoacyl peptidase
METYALEYARGEGPGRTYPGHSYGAFMTANLLAHCDLFAAGIARSGAYNRTLTHLNGRSRRGRISDRNRS